VIPLASEYPAFFGIIVAGLSTLGTVVGVLMTGIGKKGDQKAQAASDEFKRMVEEITYWHTAAIDCRAELAGADHSAKEKDE
jgi:hypothetical protein